MAYSNIQTIDLTMLRGNSNPTCDVKFTFLDENTGMKSELPAHKLILAVGNEVFMRQFFGTIPEEKDTIPVEDSSVEAFQIFLDILYNKKIALEAMDFQLLADLYYLAEKYHHGFMKDSIIKEVSSRKILSENLLEVAKVAETNAHLEELSSSLLNICFVFINKSDLGTIMDIFDNEDVGEEKSCTLHRLMTGAKRSRPDVCKNCHYAPCLDGEVLTKSNFVIGASIARKGHEKQSRKTVKVDDSRVDYVLENGSGYSAKFSEMTFMCT
eukprot:GFUD01117621.1.p1 GENE.GFUD01117621.1~~GFUD01117621.1.p1  ORF type:complete len:303 (-),score=53.14 GFUD01117621.1:21-827(-)